MTTQPESQTAMLTWRLIGLRALQVMGVAGVIALFLTLAFAAPFVPTLVYSVCTTFFCWLFIEAGSRLLARWLQRGQPASAADALSDWPSAGWMSAVLLVGTVAGFTLGGLTARTLLSQADFQAAGMDGRSIAAALLVAIVVGIATTYYFYSGARLAASVAEAEQAQRMATEQRLKLLASQLEPHMLFNTLANLRALIAIDPPRAQAMLDRLIQFLRATLDATRTRTHPLAEEFAHLGNYLELMQIRMGTRLQTQLTLPRELGALAVPTLLLQPLVENAIKHGLEPHVEGGRVEVSAEREGAQLVLRVRDTGAGLTQAAARAGTGFGLEQVRERLAALYGPAASLELAAAPAGAAGVLATLRLPL